MTDTHAPMPEDDDLLAAEYVLGLAPEDVLQEAAARARHDAAFAQRVAGWQERFVAMTDGIDPVTPPKRVRRRILKQISTKTSVPLVQRLWVWQGISLAALCLAAYLAAPLLRPPPPDVPVDVFATHMTGDVDDLAVLAVFDPAEGDITLRRLSGAAPEGRVLELWAILPDQAPVSLGVLPGDALARVALPEDFATQAEALTLAISDEPQGGAPAGAPTGDIRAVGSLIEL